MLETQQLEDTLAMLVLLVEEMAPMVV